MSKLKMLKSRVPMADLSRVPKQPKQADPFYHSTEWRRVAKAVKQERGRSCEKCGKTEGRIYADHIVERRDGGDDLDPGNVQLLCASCHTKKTNEARSARMARRVSRPRP